MKNTFIDIDLAACLCVTRHEVRAVSLLTNVAEAVVARLLDVTEKMLPWQCFKMRRKLEAQNRRVKTVKGSLAEFQTQGNCDKDLQLRLQQNKNET